MHPHGTPNAICEQCGKQFYKNPNPKLNHRHCSYECQRQSAIARVPDRFWARVDKSGGPDACWEWQGSRNNRGYGQIKVRTADGVKMIRVNRMALILSGVEVPDHMLACHSCDNPPCCNPAHLFVGTNADNTHDAMDKGRIKRSLTATDVVEVRRLYRDGVHTYQSLADQFGCGMTTIRDAIKRYTWKDVE